MAPVTIGIGNADFELGYLAKNSLMLNKGGLPGGGGGISPSSLSDGDICSMIVTRIFFRFLDLKRKIIFKSDFLSQMTKNLS